MSFISSSVISFPNMTCLKERNKKSKPSETLGIGDATLKSNEYPAQWSMWLISGLIMEKPCYLESVDDPMVTGVWQWKCPFLPRQAVTHRTLGVERWPVIWDAPVREDVRVISKLSGPIHQKPDKLSEGELEHPVLCWLVPRLWVVFVPDPGDEAILAVSKD